MTDRQLFEDLLDDFCRDALADQDAARFEALLACHADWAREARAERAMVRRIRSAPRPAVPADFAASVLAALEKPAPEARVVPMTPPARRHFWRVVSAAAVLLAGATAVMTFRSSQPVVPHPKAQMKAAARDESTARESQAPSPEKPADREMAPAPGGAAEGAVMGLEDGRPMTRANNERALEGKSSPPSADFAYRRQQSPPAEPPAAPPAPALRSVAPAGTGGIALGGSLSKDQSSSFSVMDAKKEVAAASVPPPPAVEMDSISRSRALLESNSMAIVSQQNQQNQKMDQAAPAAASVPGMVADGAGQPASFRADMGVAQRVKAAEKKQAESENRIGWSPQEVLELIRLATSFGGRRAAEEQLAFEFPSKDDARSFREAVAKAGPPPSAGTKGRRAPASTLESPRLPPVRFEEQAEPGGRIRLTLTRVSTP